MTESPIATITSVYGPTVEIIGPDGRLRAQLRGKLRLAGDRKTILPGDRVTYEVLGPEEVVVTEVLPRRNQLSRQDCLGRRELAIMANLDGIVAVFAGDRPKPDFLFLDRILATAEYLSLKCTIVFNKADLVPDDFFNGEAETYRALGYTVLVTSTVSGQGLKELEQLLESGIRLLVGPSGTGKSSLLNALIGDADQSTQEVQTQSGRGKHTTTRVNLFLLPLGGFLADSPGLREFTLWEIPFDELADCFPEFGRVEDSCRFADCRHAEEPGCAIKAAIAEGLISERRHRSYLMLLKERKAAHKARYD